MKIGIITLSASNNCGSLLQAYALKKTLEKYGDVDVINFSSKESHVMYDAPHYRGIRNILNYKRIKILSKGVSDYDSFRRDYIGISGKEYQIEDLKEISDYYDVVVAGSDQVWNVQMWDYSDAFFLGWSNSRKVAYAPSLGGSHLSLSHNLSEIKRWLEDISFLSVREDTGKKCLEEVTGREVPKLLDPTLILNEDQWNQLIGEPLIKGDYIFYYSWAYCEDDTSRIVTNKSKQSGMPVYVIDSRKWVSKKPKKWNFYLFESTGPITFLNLMKYAKLCYVESFHGMVFAYIFKKNFWLLDTHERIEDLDYRLSEFVKIIGAQNRVLTKYNCAQIDQDKCISYENNELLNRLKIESWNYLDAAFKEFES